MVAVSSAFPDLRDDIRIAGFSHARIASSMGYRPDEFSRVMNGHQPPKGGMSAEEFRAEVRRILRELKRGAA